MNQPAAAVLDTVLQHAGPAGLGRFAGEAIADAANSVDLGPLSSRAGEALAEVIVTPHIILNSPKRDGRRRESFDA
ncbi:hypothetical protein [Streptomyces sp. WAC00263]|uniref:hypothetical protein n=1 Tax=Streptomyces sp. WAC00263 TaxID=1917422 RepID=UPI0015EFC868|nr:hypothetical protein [Streptomyces sp. WAC00263]KAF5990732.1 hypothetical protein BOG92_000820 [Streptomyces sp. WAC00263]